MAVVLATGMPREGSASSREQAAASSCAEGDAVCASSSSKVPKLQLGSLSISPIIMGQWQLAGGHGAYDPAEAVENMVKHYDAGITTVDTADIYGPSEEIVGTFLKQRPEAVVCTKFCCFQGLARIDKKQVRKRILDSCKRLGVRSLDLVALFWSDFEVKRYVQVAKWLTELKEEGLIREIGVTNFDTPHLKELVDAGVPVVSNQVQYSIVDRRAQNGLSSYCEQSSIKLLCYGSVGGGLLSSRFLAKQRPGRSTLDTSSLRMYASSVSRFGGWELFQELLSALSQVAEKRGVTIANVATRYVLDQQAVGGVIIGVRNSKHIQENVAALNLTLDADDNKILESVLAKAQGPEGDVYGYERGVVV